MTSDFRTYLNKTGELPDDVILGYISLTRITDEPIRRDDLVKWFDDQNLNPGLLPPPIRAVDAYRKATSDAEDFTYTTYDGLTATILTRDVAITKEMICRHLIREIRDADHRLLVFNKVGEAVFYYASSVNGKVQPGTERFRLVIDDAGLVTDERPHVEALIKQIETDYDRYVNYLDGQKLRAVVRQYQLYLNAIELKGGVYFIHSNRADELRRLQTVVSMFGGGCRMNLIPLIDLDDERQMVVEAFQREAAESLNNIVVEITQLRANRKKVTPNAYAKIREKYDTVMNQANEYLRTLGISQDTTAAAAEVALDALVELQTSMYAGGTP